MAIAIVTENVRRAVRGLLLWLDDSDPALSPEIKASASAPTRLDKEVNGSLWIRPGATSIRALIYAKIRGDWMSLGEDLTEYLIETYGRAVPMTAGQVLFTNPFTAPGVFTPDIGQPDVYRALNLVIQGDFVGSVSVTIRGASMISGDTTETITATTAEAGQTKTTLNAWAGVRTATVTGTISAGLMALWTSGDLGVPIGNRTPTLIAAYDVDQAGGGSIHTGMTLSAYGKLNTQSQAPPDGGTRSYAIAYTLA